MNLRDKIYDIPDFPQKGITFRDLTPLMLDPHYFKETIRRMLNKIKHLKIDVICGIDSRGFLFGPVLADRLNVGFVLVRKSNKLLPRKTIEQKYASEYGTDGVKIHTDSIKPGQRALIVDDLVATGGTVKATCQLVEKLGGKVVGLLFLSELTHLKPRIKLKKYKIISLIKY